MSQVGRKAPDFPRTAILFSASNTGLQNLYSAVRSRPAPPFQLGKKTTTYKKICSADLRPSVRAEAGNMSCGPGPSDHPSEFRPTPRCGRKEVLPDQKLNGRSECFGIPCNPLLRGRRPTHARCTGPAARARRQILPCPNPGPANNTGAQTGAQPPLASRGSESSSSEQEAGFMHVLILIAVAVACAVGSVLAERRVPKSWWRE